MSEFKMCVKCLSSYESDKEACPFCGCENKNTNPAGALEVGTVIGDRYTIGAFVEIDGEGVVYHGVDNTEKKRVMIKEFMPVTLCSGRKGQAIMPRAESEVLFKTALMEFSEVYRSLLNMKSEKALCSVEDVVSANGTVYAVTEYVKGEKLEDYVEKFGGSLDWRDAMAMLEPVFIAMEKMHRLDWMHKGISPENIIVAEDGTAKLTGYATLALRTTGSEFKAQLYPGYSAPEQYSVTEYQGPYTDIYSLAAVLYRVVTGRRPQSARDRARNDAVAPVSQYTNVPRYFSAAISRAMRLEPNERFATIEEFREALANVSDKTAKKTGFALDEKSKIAIYITGGIIGLVLIIVILWSIIRAALPNKNTESDISDISDISVSEVISSSADSAVDSSKQEEVLTIPNFAGKKYTDVQNNYPQFLFVMEEEFNNNYEAGEIISQSPMEGSVYVAGSTITLKVSKGPETVKLPQVIGITQSSAETALSNLNIRYTIVTLANDGSYQEGNVVKTDKEEGSDIRISLDTVVLYVAGPAPVVSSSESAPQEPASSSQTPTESSSDAAE